MRRYSLRLPESLFDEIKKLAQDQEKSVNHTIIELLEEKIKELRKKKRWEELYNAFSLIGLRDSDVEFAVDAQEEVQE